MEQKADSRIDQCLNDIQKYKKWGKLPAGQSLTHLFNSNALVSALAIHNAKRTSRQQAHQYRKRKTPETNRH